MRWEDERYVRLYTRDTVTWKLLPWQSRALLPLIFRKVDRAGLIDLGGESVDEAVAAVVEMPLEVVKPGLEKLIDRHVVEVKGDTLIVPNFIEAQEAAASDTQRKRDERERARAAKRLQDVTERDGQSQNVTNSHEMSRPVTPCLAVPSLAVTDKKPPETPAASSGAGGVFKLEPTGKPQKQPKQKRPPTPEEARLHADTNELVKVYQDAWVRSRRPDDGKPPKVRKPDYFQAKDVVKQHGLDAAKALVVRFLGDADPWLTKQGHPLRLLTSRVDGYRAGAPGTGPPRNVVQARDHVPIGQGGIRKL